MTNKRGQGPRGANHDNKTAIETVVDGKDLTYDMALGAMREIMNGEANEAQSWCVCWGLFAVKGETIDEIPVLLKACVKKPCP